MSAPTRPAPLASSTMFFSASVETLPHYLAQCASDGLGKKEQKILRGKFETVQAHLTKKVWPSKADTINKMLFPAEAGERMSHIMIDKFGVLADLREHASDTTEQWRDEGRVDADAAPFGHLLNLGDTDNLVLPIRFATPIKVEIPGRGLPLPVSSAIMLRDELELLNEDLQVEKTFRLAKLPEFIQATQEEIEKFERMGSDPDFWTKFGLVILRMLCNVALKNKLPIVFHYVG